MRGTPHDVFPCIGGGVGLANDQDDHYYTAFESWDEIREFIAKLESVAAEVLGPEVENKKPRRGSRRAGS